MAAELVPDTDFAPWDLPADAVLVVRWQTEDHPNCWKVVGVTSGATLDEAKELGVRAVGGGTHDILATKIGGNSAALERMTANQVLSTRVSGAPVEAPNEVAVADAD